MGFLGESASHASCFGLPDGGWYVVADRILWVSMGRSAEGNSYHYHKTKIPTSTKDRGKTQRDQTSIRLASAMFP